MLATIKIIPFAVPRAELEHALAIARDGAPAATLHAFAAREAGLVATRLPGTKPGVMDKSRAVLDARLAAMGSRIADEIRCDHNELAVADAVRKLASQGRSPILVFGASATVDRRDVVPAGIEKAGGEVLHFGMPVDPGNLMLLAGLNKTPVVGLPGCARSPKLNGFDWVLARLMAGLDVAPRDVMAMGIGGLLKEIPSRPQPREGGRPKPSSPRVAAIILAAGQSRRMGGPNKLTMPVEGKPMVRHVAEAALASAADTVIVVTGDRAAEVEKALDGLAVTVLSNKRHKEGLSTSLGVGISGLPGDVDAALICLGDMPDIRSHHLDRLIAAFDPEEGRTICVPTVNGKRGNPVLWGSEWFAAMMETKGDTGAKHLIGEHPEAVCEVEMQDDAALKDVDTMEEWERRRGT